MKKTKEVLKKQINQALGKEPCDLVIKNISWLNLVTGDLEKSDIAISEGQVVGTFESYHGRHEIDGSNLYAAPGFIDAHVHTESSLVKVEEFERCVLTHGTTTAIADPHEIANVLGSEGLDYYISAVQKLLMDVFVQLPSCVPATFDFETSGASLSADDLKKFRGRDKVLGLAEFMNFPGVFALNDDVLEKLSVFSDGHIDGHSPLVRGRELNAYLSCNIKTCHETTSYDEALEKIKKGMQVLIREGSVSKDLNALIKILNGKTAPFLGFCTDDRNPLDIAHEGHLNYLIKKAIEKGADLLDVYRASSWSVARGFGLKDRGLIAPGYKADIVLLSDLKTCEIHRVIKSGILVSEDSFKSNHEIPQHFLKSVKLKKITKEDLKIKAIDGSSSVIGLIENQIVSNHLKLPLLQKEGEAVCDLSRDILKICVFERHGKNGNIGRGFVQGFGLKKGAIASTVGHDSHNLCVLGCNDDDMALAVNSLIDAQGGFVCVLDGKILKLVELPLAGLMSLKLFQEVEKELHDLRSAVKTLGCSLPEPFLQLAFLPLAVIPHLKITDKGLVDITNSQSIAA